MVGDTPGFLLAVFCLVAVTPLSLVGALLIRRRINAIAPDGETKRGWRASAPGPRPPSSSPREGEGEPRRWRG